MKKDLVCGVLSILCAVALMACCLYDIESRLDSLRSQKQVHEMFDLPK